MADDNPIPLASGERLLRGALAGLARDYNDRDDSRPLDDIMIEATRACETETTRRLAPFTGLTESHRADAIDPDEFGGDNTPQPMDFYGAVGSSYSAAVGANSLVRRFWVSQYAPCFQDMWTYSDMSIEIVTSTGGLQRVARNEVLNGPEPDTGMVWFQVGTYLPVGSLIRVTYGGGYSTVPADLARAATYMGAAIIARELDPLGESYGHSPEQLEAVAIQWLSPWLRH